jgi:hypothetical protein
VSNRNLLTLRQERSVDSLPEGYKVITTRYGAVMVRRPDGRLLRVRADGSLVTIAPVRRVESYLQLNG